MFHGLSYHVAKIDRNFVRGCTIAGAQLVQILCTLTVFCFCAPSFQLDVYSDTMMVSPAAVHLYPVSVWTVVPVVCWYRLAHSSKQWQAFESPL